MYPAIFVMCVYVCSHHLRTSHRTFVNKTHCVVYFASSFSSHSYDWGFYVFVKFCVHVDVYLYYIVGIVVCNIKYIQHIFTFTFSPASMFFASYDFARLPIYFMFTQFFYLLRFNLIPPLLLSMQRSVEWGNWTKQIYTEREGVRMWLSNEGIK